MSIGFGYGQVVMIGTVARLRGRYIYLWLIKWPVSMQGMLNELTTVTLVSRPMSLPWIACVAMMWLCCMADAFTSWGKIGQRMIRALISPLSLTPALMCSKVSRICSSGRCMARKA